MMERKRGFKKGKFRYAFRKHPRKVSKIRKGNKRKRIKNYQNLLKRTTQDFENLKRQLYFLLSNGNSNRGKRSQKHHSFKIQHKAHPHKKFKKHLPHDHINIKKRSNATSNRHVRNRKSKQRKELGGLLTKCKVCDELIFLDGRSCDMKITKNDISNKCCVICNSCENDYEYEVKKKNNNDGLYYSPTKNTIGNNANKEDNPMQFSPISYSNDVSPLKRSPKGKNKKIKSILKDISAIHQPSNHKKTVSFVEEDTINNQQEYESEEDEDDLENEISRLLEIVDHLKKEVSDLKEENLKKDEWMLEIKKRVKENIDWFNSFFSFEQ